MAMDSEKIKARLKKFIKDNPDINQKVVAHKIGKSKSYLSQVLNNERIGSFDLIRKIAEAAGTNLEALMADDGVKKASNRPFHRYAEVMALPIPKRPWAIKVAAAEANGLMGWHESSNNKIPREHQRYFDGEITEVDLFEQYDRLFKRLAAKLDKQIEEEGL